MREKLKARLHRVAVLVKRYRDHMLSFLLLACCLGVVTSIMFVGSRTTERLMAMEKDSNAIISRDQQLIIRVERMLAAERGYVLTGDEKFAEDYGIAKEGATDVVAQLGALVAKDPAQTYDMEEVQRDFGILTKNLDAGRASPRTSGKAHADAEAAGKELLRVAEDMLQNEQKALDAEQRQINETRDFNRTRVLAGFFVTALLFLLFNSYYVRANVQRRSSVQGLGEGSAVFRLAIEGASDGFFEWNFQGGKSFCSRQYSAMLGYEPGEFPGTIDTFYRQLHPDDVARVRDYIDQYIAGEVSEYNNVFRMKHRTGKWVWINARGKVIYDDSGRPWRLVGAHTDISHIKAYEEKLERSKEAAEQANRAKSEFLAHMSHEIRTPLTAISGIAEIFESRQDNLDSKQKQLVKTLNSSTATLKDLVNDILDFSKIESGELTLDRTTFLLGDLLDQVMSIFIVRASEKGIAFNFDYESVAGEKFVGDRIRLRQILINLIGNAVKFTDEGSINVSARKVLRGGQEMLQIEVRDTGIGIAPENRAVIFERFKQADSSMSRKYGGTGLGLPISLRLARLMNGDISVESVLGKGSCFRLDVPMKLRAEDVRDEEGGQESPPDDSSLVAALDGKDVLLVEDYSGNVVILSYLLDGLQCRYDTAQTGLEALDKWQAKRYDLILMDVQMPEMDGFTATSSIRRIEQEKSLPHTPIIGMTAHALTGDREKCIEAGMDAYLSKPIVDSELKAKMLEMLRGRRSAA